MKARDAMNLLVYRCQEEESIEYCARIMREENIGFIPVVDHEDRLVGVVTDRDLVVRALAEGRPPETQVGDVCSRVPLITCTLEEDLQVVEQRMSVSQKSRVLVVDSAFRCIGVISLSNIAQVETDSKRVGSLLNALTHREAAQVIGL